jgi:hypothetical protein
MKPLPLDSPLFPGSLKLLIPIFEDVFVPSVQCGLLHHTGSAHRRARRHAAQAASSFPFAPVSVSAALSNLTLLNRATGLMPNAEAGNGI